MRLLRDSQVSCEFPAFRLFALQRIFSRGSSWLCNRSDVLSQFKELTMNEVILRLPQVMARVGLSRSSIYLSISRKEFPQQVRLGARAVGWVQTEIDEWVRRRISLDRDPE
jgi:prophage regulatory protein